MTTIGACILNTSCMLKDGKSFWIRNWGTTLDCACCWMSHPLKWQCHHSNVAGYFRNTQQNWVEEVSTPCDISDSWFLKHKDFWLLCNMHVGGSTEHSYDVTLYLIIVTDINKMWDDTTLVGVLCIHDVGSWKKGPPADNFLYGYRWLLGCIQGLIPPLVHDITPTPVDWNHSVAETICLCAQLLYPNSRLWIPNKWKLKL